MMGKLGGGEEKLFYAFSIEDAVPQDHLLRRIDRFLDLSELRAELQPYYSAIGRPSVDPELMVRMLLVGYRFGIRSERRLCEEVHLNLAYRWFCRLGLEDRVPDHSTFSKARHGRFRDAGLFRSLFEATVRRCMAEGLVGGEGFATDASLINADASKNRSAWKGEPVDWADPKIASRPVGEYLDALGSGPKVKEKARVSLTDPAAQWTCAHGGPAHFAWSTNYLLDVEASVIVDVEASPAVRPAEVAASRLMVDRAEERFGLKPKRLMGDTAYGSAEMLGWMVSEKGIEPHVALLRQPDRKKADGFGRSDFSYDLSDDAYTCPTGKKLKRFRREGRAKKAKPPSDGTYRYYALKADCEGCPLKPRCCPGQPMRKIPRSIHEDARDGVRRLQPTEAYAASQRDRKKVEMAFAHLKRNLGLRRLRLKGPTGAQDEFLLAATVQNLRKLAERVPSAAVAAA
ncbi:IS1182 family transposase [Parvularcula oceani]|uniref:IS1182 family transposase n=1 Tax=Parvularcula oceani TaxID=1247963 RepID=UPI0004E18F29|nr:IS1182 family transposase [Parvularcula oceani]